MSTLEVTLLILAVMTATGVIMLPFLPSRPPMQYAEKGRVTWSAGKYFGALFYPLLLTAIVGAFWFADPSGQSHFLLPFFGAGLLLIQLVHLATARKK